MWQLFIFYVTSYVTDAVTRAAELPVLRSIFAACTIHKGSAVIYSYLP
jgi:hypothetical protein